jgi:phosphatidylinositol alpha-1,6-mannosyltransferase
VPSELRVLILSPDYPPSHGGIQLLLHRLARHMELARVKVLTLGVPQAHEAGNPEGVDVVRVPARALGGRRWAIARLNLQAPATAARFRPDVVLSGHIVCAPGARLIKRVLGVPYVQYLHGAEVADRPSLAALALEGAAAGVAVSRHTADLAGRLVSPTRTCVHRIPPGVDLPPQGRAGRGGEPVVVTVSRMAERYKGHDVMIRALPLIRARVPEAAWVIVGDGPLRYCWERLVRVLGQERAVDFVGAIDDSERDRLLDQASVFALLSRPMANAAGEGFGIVYLEAAAHGLPVVAARGAGVLDSVVDGVTGLLVDPLDHVGTAEAVTSLLLDPVRAEALGRAGAVHAREYSWSQVAGRVREVLAGAADRREAAA